MLRHILAQLVSIAAKPGFNQSDFSIGGCDKRAKSQGRAISRCITTDRYSTISSTARERPFGGHALSSFVIVKRVKDPMSLYHLLDIRWRVHPDLQLESTFLD